MRVLGPEPDLTPGTQIDAEVDAALLDQNVVFGDANIAVVDERRLTTNFSIDRGEERLLPLERLVPLGRVTADLPEFDFIRPLSTQAVEPCLLVTDQEI